MLHHAITHSYNGLFFWNNFFSLLKATSIVIYSASWDYLVFIGNVLDFHEHFQSVYHCRYIGYVVLCGTTVSFLLLILLLLLLLLLLLSLLLLLLLLLLLFLALLLPLLLLLLFFAKVLFSFIVTYLQIFHKYIGFYYYLQRIMSHPVLKVFLTDIVLLKFSLLALLIGKKCALQGFL